MDLSRAKSILEWEPTVSMIDGFKKYVSDVIAARAKMQ
jgi:nucleoside-diphosphate-sugar epimerase